MKSLSLLIKPASSLCNMRCRYCFYADVASHREVACQGVMAPDTMRAVIDRAFEVGTDTDVTFAFQGGEPTLAGLDYFEAFVAAVQEKRAGQSVHYALQTNGLLLDEQWVSFLKKHHFLVGLSLDGPQTLHDYVRPDAKGAGTYHKVVQAANLLRAGGVPFNILSVLTSQAAKHPQNLYRFFSRLGCEHVQLIPCLPGLDGQRTAYALAPREFASFYKVFYRLWMNDVARGRAVFHVTLFDNLAMMFAGYAPQQCGMMGVCFPQYVVEGTGDVYPCDFYVLDEYRCGNVKSDSLKEIFESAPMQGFFKEPRRHCSSCEDCPFVPVCRRNCKRLNVAYYTDTYCGYRDFLEFAAPSLGRLSRMM